VLSLGSLRSFNALSAACTTWTLRRIEENADDSGIARLKKLHKMLQFDDKAMVRQLSELSAQLIQVPLECSHMLPQLDEVVLALEARVAVVH
jgi:hypothetical protein